LTATSWHSINFDRRQLDHETQDFGRPHNPRQMALARRVFKQEAAPGTKAPDLTITRFLSLESPRENAKN